MSIATPTFWRLLGESRLLTAEQLRQLAADYGQGGSVADGADAKELADWLVSRNVLSRYQSTILSAGRSGPFLYGEYSVYDRIDRGRLAGCFRAVHRPTGHPVLLQFLTGSVVSDPAQWAQAANLALAACAIQSPHIQRFLEPVDLGTFKFLVSEDLRGSSLEDRLAQGRMPLAEACRLVRLAAIGLAQMHQAGRVHGDVRPANLWLETPARPYPGNLKLLYEPHVVPGPLLLTDTDPSGRLAVLADYLAPELAQPGKVPDPLTDIYGLGCTLYAALAGSVPFAGGSPQQKFLRHATEPIRPLEQFGIPQPVAQLVAFLMAKNPAVRFQSAAMVAEQLTPFVEPQVAFLPPPSLPATLATYEMWVRQRQLRQPAPVAAPKPAPAIDVKVLTEDNRRAALYGGSTTAGSDTAAAYQKTRQRRQIQALIGGSIAALVLLAGGIYFVNWMRGLSVPIDDNPVASTGGRDDHQVAKTPGGTNDGTGGSDAANVQNTSTSGAKGDTKSKGAQPEVEGGQQVVADDGKLLWASPTSGQNVNFRLMPPEGQVFLIARPAAILASREGPKVLEALGPAFAARRSAWEAAAGVTLDQVDQVIVGLHNNDGQFPRISVVVRPREPITTEQLLAKWGQPQEQKEGVATWYAGKEWAYYISGNAEDRGAFLMAAPADVKEVAKVAGAPPALLRDVERLRRSTDSDRHLTLLFNPAFLFNDDGQPLSWFLGEGLQAAQASLHFGDSFYFEMRMLGSLDKEKYALASEFRDRLKTVPTNLENYMDRLTPPNYWSKLARRYPLMVAALHSSMRVGVEDDQAVVNSYLEGPAAHSLVLGGELLVASAPGAAVATAGPTEPGGPKTIDEVLGLKTSMSFGAQSLEFAMRDIADDVRANLLKGSSVEFEIKLIGKDMEKDGITRNQTIRDFKQENKTVAEVLTAMVMKANAPNVPDPSMPEQKLIWVVAPDPDKPTRQIVLITTRTAAERDKYKLPAPFQPKP